LAEHSRRLYTSWLGYFAGSNRLTYEVIAIGEALWDLFPGEAHVGGAPTNVAIHAAALGARSSIVTRLGQDERGRGIFRTLEAKGVDLDLVQWDELHPTGTVEVLWAREGEHRFVITENVAWDAISDTEHALQAVNKADAVCFGTLGQRTARAQAAIAHLVSSTNVRTLRLLDVNLRPPFISREVIQDSLHLANVVKVNEEELSILNALLFLGNSARDSIDRLARQFDLNLVALTRGPKGSLLWQSGEWSELPPTPVSFVDGVGAGDAFSAALIMGLLRGEELGDIQEFATELAGFVCSQRGATPPLPEEFRNRFASDTPGRRATR
jgi:fructokinase